MKQLKFVLPAMLIFFSLEVFAQTKKPVVPPTLPEQPVALSLPTPPPPAPPEEPVPPPFLATHPPPHLKMAKEHSAKHLQKFKETDLLKKPVKPLPPPALPKEE